MVWKGALGVAALAVASVSAAQQATPDYISFTAKAEYLAHMATSVASCTRLGFDVDSDGLLGYTQDMIADAVRGGIDLSAANRIISGAIDREEANQQFLADSVKNGSDESKREHVEYWFERCEGIEADPIGSNFFSFNAQKVLGQEQE